jgi:hypothetical protein
MCTATYAAGGCASIHAVDGAGESGLEQARVRQIVNEDHDIAVGRVYLHEESTMVRTRGQSMTVSMPAAGE